MTTFAARPAVSRNRQSIATTDAPADVLEQDSPSITGVYFSSKLIRPMIHQSVGMPGAAAFSEGVEILGDVVPWARQTVTDLARLAHLGENWDSEGASAINLDAIQAAASFANAAFGPRTPRPAIVPTRCGGVQLEWHTRQIDLEIEFCGPESFYYSFEDFRDSVSREGAGKTDWSILLGFVQELSRRRPNVESR